MAITNVSQSITRPNNASGYTAGLLIGQSQTAASVVPFKFGLPYPAARIYGLSLTKGSSTAGKFTAHLFNGTPSSITSGDTTSISVGSAGYLTSFPIDLSTVTQFSSGAGISAMGASSAAGSNPIVTATEMGSGGCYLYALLASNTSYTPSASEVYTLTLYAEYYGIGR